MRVAGVPGVRAPNARGKGRPERDDAGWVDRQEDLCCIRSRFAGPIVIAGEVVDDPASDRGEIDTRRRDQAFG
jgi:hypothetical protein